MNASTVSVCGRMQSCACRRLANVRILYIFRVSLICLSPAATQVHRCLNGRAPPYLSEHCIPISSADTRRHLRSANRHLLAVSRFPLNTYGRRAFSVAGPMSWNSLPDFIRGIQRAAQTVLGVYLKRTCLRVTSASSQGRRSV